MSDSIVWQIISKSNSKSLRRTHPVSRKTYEKGSLRNFRIKADSGIARTRAVDVAANDEGIPVLSFKNANPDDRRNPDKMWKTLTLTGGVRKALVKTELAMDAYSPSLKKVTMRKVSALYKAHGRKNAGVDHSVFIPQ